jgi:Acyl-CoA reductase (LuxC)
MDRNIASMIIRGRVIEDDLVEFGGRGGSLVFRAPDPHKHAVHLPVSSPAALADLYDLRFDDILDYLDALGERLEISRNAYLQEARELTYRTAPTTQPIVDTFYAGIRSLFRRDRVRAIADHAIGIRYLDGWVEQAPDERVRGFVRAFGARTLHVIAGNSPTVAAETVIRNAMTRSDCIIKLPSNDPFTAIAICKTMC